MNFSQAPLVSVIMNCLNGERYLREAIDSVYSQTYLNWEIIFWDNASTDRSAEIAGSYDDRIRYFHGDKTVPLGEARNKALKEAQGSIIAFLDCDDIWLPEKLAMQVPLFRDLAIGLVYSNALYFTNQGRENKLYKKKVLPAQGYCFSLLLRSYFLCLPTVMISRSVLETTSSWFDPRFNMISDADLFLRIAYRYKLAGISKILVRYRMHEESLSWKNPNLFISETQLMLKSYKESYLDFEKKYKNEIRELNVRLVWGSALTLLSYKRILEARLILASIEKWNLRILILYLLSYMPAQFVSNFIKRIRVQPAN